MVPTPKSEGMPAAQLRPAASTVASAPPNLPAIPLDHYTSATSLEAQAAELGVPIEKLAEAEAASGAALDPRVSRLQLDTMATYYQDAQLDLLHAVATRRLAAPLPVLFAPTARTVDYMIGSEAVPILVNQLIREGKQDELIQAIDAGPSDGSLVWDRPANSVQLIADIIRWSVLGEEVKKRLRTSDEVRGWIGKTLNQANCPTHARLGGVSAVGSALASVLGYEPVMFALGELPAEVEQELSKHKVRVVGDDPRHKTLADLPKQQMSSGHFCLNAHRIKLLPLSELGPLTVGGKVVDLNQERTLDLIISSSSVVPDFGNVGTNRLRSLGVECCVAILTGAQNLSDSKQIRAYADHVEALHEGGAPTALLYSESRHPASESLVWRELRDRKVIDYFSLNTGESFYVLARILDQARKDNPLGLEGALMARLQDVIVQGSTTPTEWESGSESPRWVLQSAALLQEILGIPLVRVRAKAVDVLVVANDVSIINPDRVRNHLIASRHMATTKVANDSGLIDLPEELTLLKNVPHGKYLAGLHQLSDALNDLNVSKGAKPTRPSNIATTCYDWFADGRLCFATVPIPFFDRTGGTPSAGDNADTTFSIEARDLLLSARESLRRKSPA